MIPSLLPFSRNSRIEVSTTEIVFLLLAQALHSAHLKEPQLSDSSQMSITLSLMSVSDHKVRVMETNERRGRKRLQSSSAVDVTRLISELLLCGKTSISRECMDFFISGDRINRTRIIGAFIRRSAVKAVGSCQ